MVPPPSCGSLPVEANPACFTAAAELGADANSVSARDAGRPEPGVRGVRGDCWAWKDSEGDGCGLWCDEPSFETASPSVSLEFKEH